MRRLSYPHSPAQDHPHRLGACPTLGPCADAQNVLIRTAPWKWRRLGKKPEWIRVQNLSQGHRRKNEKELLNSLAGASGAMCDLITAGTPLRRRWWLKLY